MSTLLRVGRFLRILAVDLLWPPIGVLLLLVGMSAAMAGVGWLVGWVVGAEKRLETGLGLIVLAMLGGCAAALLYAGFTTTRRAWRQSR